MALLHKGLPFEAIPWRFTEKQTIAFSGQGLVPVLVDGDLTVFDKWKIAEYLEEAYPDRPSLFGGERGQALAHFVTNWTSSVIAGHAIRLILTRFGMSLEAAVEDRDTGVGELRRSLQPLRMSLARTPYLSGDAPAWADYVAFGPFQWARSVSRFQLIKSDDPVFAWRSRMIDLFDQAANKVHILNT